VYISWKHSDVVEVQQQIARLISMDTVVPSVSAGIVVANDLKYTKRLRRFRQPSISSVVVLVLLRVETHLCFG
jgi:hypothetical protein